MGRRCGGCGTRHFAILNEPCPDRSVSSPYLPILSVLSVTKDPRIHMALNCGARSCPPIRVFSAKNLESELEGAAGGIP